MSKKISKAAATTKNKDEPSYEIRDIVLGKIRGFPAWPGIVVDPESVPKNVSKERPASKKAFYCVRFFPAGDYAWLIAKDISKLKTHEIEAYINEPSKKSGDLLTGYQVALDPTKWEADRSNMTFEATPSDEEQEDEEDIDELDEEGGPASNGKKSKSTTGKKRKRESDAALSKTEKRGRGRPRKSETEPKVRNTSSTKKGGKKSKETIESEDEAGDGEAEGTEQRKGNPPPTKKAKKSKDDEQEADSPLLSDPEAVKVRDWRHKLQKIFLAKTPAKEETMPEVDLLLKTVETYGNMNVEYLQFSKIGKVMRHISALSEEKVPRDTEFKFRERAQNLVDKWHDVVGGRSSSAKNGTADANGKTDKPTAEDVKMDVEVNSKEVKDVSKVDPAKAPQEDVTKTDAVKEENTSETGAKEAHAQEDNAPPLDIKLENAKADPSPQDVVMTNGDASVPPTDTETVVEDVAKDSAADAPKENAGQPMDVTA